MTVQPPSDPDNAPAAPTAPEPPAGQPPPPSYPTAPAYSGGPPAYSSAPAAFGHAGPAPGYAYAGFGPRFLGFILDSIVLVVVQAVLTVPLYLLPAIQFYQAHPPVSGQPLPALPAAIADRALLLGVVGAVITALYYWGLVTWQGRTLGQRAVGVYVVREEDGGRLPSGRAFIRSLIFWVPGLLGVVRYVSLIAFLLEVIGLLAVAWDPRKQGWHDKLARSLVVKRAPGY